MRYRRTALRMRSVTALKRFTVALA